MGAELVIVIGAGAAGLSAAERLAAKGVRVEVIEARKRIGGRIFTVRPKGMALPLELGAEFVHGRAPATVGLIDRSGAVAYDVPFEHMRREHGRLKGIPAYEKVLEKELAGLADVGRRDVSFRDYLRGQPGGTRTAAARQALDFVRGFDAADPDQASAKALAEEQESVGAMDQTQSRLLQGYGELMEFLYRELWRRGVAVHVGHPVVHVSWKRRQVAVRCAGDKAQFRGTRAVVTLPAGVLATRPPARGAVRFDPEVPALRAGLEHTATGPVVKVLLVFRERFWEDPAFARRAKAGEELANASFLHEMSAPIPVWWTARPLRLPVLTGWAGGPKAAALAGLSRENLERTALQSLGRLFGVSAASLRRQLRDMLFHDWPADPFARGAYSYLTVDGMGSRELLSTPAEGTLFFAGEASDISGEASTVAGAIAGGQRAADQILKRM